MFLTVKLLPYDIFGNHGNSYLYNLFEKWAQVGKHNFRIIAFQTEWKYYFWMKKYGKKNVFDPVWSTLSPHLVTTSPQPITHQDDYPPRTITPVGQLPLRAIPPIDRTTTPKDNYPHRKVIEHNLTCTAFTDWE